MQPIRLHGVRRVLVVDGSLVVAALPWLHTSCLLQATAEPVGSQVADPSSCGKADAMCTCTVPMPFLQAPTASAQMVASCLCVHAFIAKGQADMCKGMILILLLAYCDHASCFPSLCVQAGQCLT